MRVAFSEINKKNLSIITLITVSFNGGFSFDFSFSTFSELLPFLAFLPLGVKLCLSEVGAFSYEGLRRLLYIKNEIFKIFYIITTLI
jgi:hypothetical protein